MARGRKTGGRQKGSQNRVNADLKSMIEGALGTLGGEGWLVSSAQENPAAFMSLLGKILPRDLNVAVDVALSDRMRGLLERGSGK